MGARLELLPRIKHRCTAERAVGKEGNKVFPDRQNGFRNWLLSCSLRCASRFSHTVRQDVTGNSGPGKRTRHTHTLTHTYIPADLCLSSLVYRFFSLPTLELEPVLLRLLSTSNLWMGKVGALILRMRFTSFPARRTPSAGAFLTDRRCPRPHTVPVCEGISFGIVYYTVQPSSLRNKRNKQCRP